MKIKDLVYINKNNYNQKKDKWQFINYLDTANLTENKIDNIQRLIVGKDKIPSRAKRKVQKYDILYSTVRPNQKHYGFIESPLENMLVSTGFAVLTPKPSVVPYYLYLYLTQESITNELHSIAEGNTSAYPSIKPSELGEIEINFPKIDIQKKISDLIKSLDKKIELNNQINEKLEETAKAIYKEWFVNFNFPDENGLPYKDNGGEFVDSELGKIPVGWEVVELKSIFNFQKGKKPIEIVEYEDENYLPYITLDAIRNNNVQYAKNEKVITINELNNIMVMDGASSGEIYFGYNGVLGSTFSVLNIYNESLITSSILYYMIKSIEQQIKDNTTGSAIPHTDKELVYKTLIAIPKNVDIINDIDKILLKFRLQMINNSNQNIKLDNLKNLLLNKLMSGQIDVDKLNIDWDKLDKTLKEVENLV